MLVALHLGGVSSQNRLHPSGTRKCEDRQYRSSHSTEALWMARHQRESAVVAFYLLTGRRATPTTATIMRTRLARGITNCSRGPWARAVLATVRCLHNGIHAQCFIYLVSNETTLITCSDKKRRYSCGSPIRSRKRASATRWRAVHS